MTHSETLPRYATAFECLGAACPDTCCGGWIVDVDHETYGVWAARDAQLAGSSLTSLVREPAGSERKHDVTWLLASAKDSACACLTEDKLCGVQMSLGESAIPLTCATYPRAYTRSGDRVEMHLHLSCPEAARLALSDPGAMQSVVNVQPPARRGIRERKSSGLASPSEREDPALDVIDATAAMLVEAVRSLIGTPSLTAWQALALYWQTVASLPLGANASNERASVIERIVAMCEETTRSCPSVLAAQAATMCLEQELSLPILLNIAGLNANRVRGKRYMSPAQTAVTQVLSAFGLDGETDAPASDDACRRCAQALQQWVEPFEAAHPHVLKNYLVNKMACMRFPWKGAAGLNEELIKLALDLMILRILFAAQAHIQQRALNIADCVQMVQSYERYAAVR